MSSVILLEDASGIPLVEPNRDGDILNIHRSIADVIEVDNPPRPGDVLMFTSGPAYRHWLGIWSGRMEVLEVLGRSSRSEGWEVTVVSLEATAPIAHGRRVEDGDWIRVACARP